MFTIEVWSMFGEDIVDEYVERSNDQATIVVRINTDQWNLTAVECNS